MNCEVVFVVNGGRQEHREFRETFKIRPQVLIDEDLRSDLEGIAELPVLLAAAVDHVDELAVHRIDDVFERAPQGELAPSGVSILAAAAVDHHHFPTVV